MSGSFQIVQSELKEYGAQYADYLREAERYSGFISVLSIAGRERLTELKDNLESLLERAENLFDKEERTEACGGVASLLQAVMCALAE